MDSIIIGTAGHVDHGKTTLIKALTGTDTDRLKEEKERGITIELGFACLALPSGEKCGIIDVPGHEKFVRNMLAGAGSIDLALFVVAADEGIMPQSREHLDILTLLNIKSGVIAVTKSDTVEKDWLDMVAQDIQAEVKGTFLENASIIPVSAKTGEGLDSLKNHLFDMIEKSRGDSFSTLSRLPIDRVFSVDGFGTVVTGTLVQGSISVGDELMIYPSLTKVKVRSLQVHSQNADAAKKGQRVAVNLSGIKTDEIKKGCVLASIGALKCADIIDVKIDVVKSTKRKITNNSRVHLHYGTDEVTCRVTLIGKDEIKAGESGYAQLKPEAPVCVRMDDRFVLRFYSPLETVGGGVVIDPYSVKRLRLDENTLRIFAAKESQNIGERVAAFILDKSSRMPQIKDLKNLFDHPEFDKELSQLIDKKEVFAVKDEVVHKDYLALIADKCRTILTDFHKKNPLLQGMKKDELRSKLFRDSNHSAELIDILHRLGYVKVSDALVADKDFKVLFNENQKKLCGEIEKIFLSGGFAPPALDEIGQKYPKDQKGFKQAADFLAADGTLVVLSAGILIHKTFFDKAVEIATQLGQNKQFTLAEFRDKIESSRKYAVALLEHFDNKGITKKSGDARTIKQ